MASDLPFTRSSADLNIGTGRDAVLDRATESQNPLLHDESDEEEKLDRTDEHLAPTPFQVDDAPYLTTDDREGTTFNNTLKMAKPRVSQEVAHLIQDDQESSDDDQAIVESQIGRRNEPYQTQAQATFS